MSKKQDKKIVGVANEELEIFGRSKSKEEIGAEKRAEKKAQRKQAKEAWAARRAELKKEAGGARKEMVAVGILLGVVVLLCVIFLGIQFWNDKEQEKYERNETLSYFINTNPALDMSEEGVVGTVTECYYTKGGYLCVKMLLGNSTDKSQRLDAIQVELYNGDTEALIGSGRTDQVQDNFVIAAGGTKEYTLYLPSDFVPIKNDSLATISYSITADSTPV